MAGLMIAEEATAWSSSQSSSAYSWWPADSIGSDRPAAGKPRGLTLAAVAKGLEQSSPHAYARSEQVRSTPGMEQLDRLLLVLDPQRGLPSSISSRPWVSEMIMRHDSITVLAVPADHMLG